MIEQLEQETRKAGEELTKAWDAPGMSPEQWANWQRNRKRNKEDIRTRRFENADAWGAMYLDTAEVRYFVAKRRYVLAKYGLSNEIYNLSITLKDQPDQMGLMIIASFKDPLAAIDPWSRLDALFAPDCAEVLQAYANPAKAVAKWLAKREAEGNPYVPAHRSDEERARGEAQNEVALAEYVALKTAMFPTKDAENAVWAQRRWLTPGEAKATLCALRARLHGM